MDPKLYLAQCRDRASATILGYKDDYCNKHLPKDVASELREIILDEIVGLCNVAFDLLDANTGVTNELYLRKINEIHRAVVKDGNVSELG